MFVYNISQLGHIVKYLNFANIQQYQTWDWNNIKHAIYQRCENEIMALIHFHLKNPIMVGKKHQPDIQYCAEVIDTSLVVDAGRCCMCGSNEMDDEQLERQLQRKLNHAFKEVLRFV